MPHDSPGEWGGTTDVPVVVESRLLANQNKLQKHIDSLVIVGFILYSQGGETGNLGKSVCWHTNNRLFPFEATRSTDF